MNQLFIRYLLIIISLLQVAIGHGQLTANFSGSLDANPTWIGDKQNFIINANGQLQLSASVAGESSLWTKYQVPKDSIEINFYVKLQFAPSNDNNGKIYLFVDNIVEQQANGYYLKIGENGSNDAIQLYGLVNGISTLLGGGTLGSMANDPADANVRITIDGNGLWTFYVDYDGGTNLEEDFMVSTPNFELQDSMFFGVYCKYTVSRIDKFFYDNISIKTIERDLTPPVITMVDVVNNQMIVSFSEKVDLQNALVTDNYFVDNGIGKPVSAMIEGSTNTKIRLSFEQGVLQSGIDYVLTASNINDLIGNNSPTSFTFSFNVYPEIGDIVLTEVLTDPYTGGDDFIEIYNKSNKSLRTDGLVIINRENGQRKVLLSSVVLKPSDYLAISNNVDFLITKYSPPQSAKFLQSSLPSLNVSSANITIANNINGAEIVLDSFDYTDDIHFMLIDETKGVSVERINFNHSSNDPQNWHSAAKSVNYATPGYQNSNYSNGNVDNDMVFSPDKKTITPNSDGLDDFVLFNYNLPKSGFLATVSVFDADGFALFPLESNALLGQSGSIKWDALDQSGNLLRSGMYIVFSRLFHPDGDVKEFKHVIVVAR